jgi:hypothetical protein
MPRAGGRNSLAVSKILKAAEKSLWASWESAQIFQHRVLRGNARETPLAHFLEQQLPSTYGICSGEAVDYKDSHTTALDLIIYDKNRNSPLAEDPFLMPAESLLAAIEVKSKLTRDELRKCYRAAKSVRSLRPFKGRFINAREGGAPVSGGEYRCMYTIFAYSSDLIPENWLDSEANRLIEVAKEEKSEVGFIDRVVVLDRGLIAPPQRTGKLLLDSGPSVFHEWFFHLMNYLTREIERRRSSMDWQLYSSRLSPGWKHFSSNVTGSNSKQD